MSDEYHAHLDECVQCREHPFAQCDTGARLLGMTVTPQPQPEGDDGSTATLMLMLALMASRKGKKR